NIFSIDTLSLALREIRALARLEHPGILQCNCTWIEKPANGWQVIFILEYQLSLYSFSPNRNTNYGDDTVFIYTEMSLCEYSLSWWLEYNRTTVSRNFQLMKKWLEQIVTALGFMHDHDIIHRNLKIYSPNFQPSNILFTHDGELKLSGFGVVADRVVNNGEEVATIQLLPKQTQMYMAPEQKEDGYTSKVDVFTLGLLLIELAVVFDADEA
ncbi:hypothetical protein PMAYCL1PPCAC_01305, partial [Pristionchus mayeri]